MLPPTISCPAHSVGAPARKPTPLALLLLGIGLTSSGVRAAETSAAVAAPETALAAVTNAYEIPKSVFLVGKQGGRDPFFPMAKPDNPDPVPVPTATPDELVRKYVVYRGIMGLPGEEVFLINNQPLKVGETAVVRLPTGRDVTLEITLLEIVDKTTVKIKATGGAVEHIKRLAD